MATILGHDKDDLKYIGQMLVAFVAVGSISAFGGYKAHQNQMPSDKIIARSSYEAFNASLNALENDNVQEAKKLVEAGNSFIWVLNERAKGDYKEYYIAVLTNCRLKDIDTDRCKSVINATMNKMYNVSDLTANETVTDWN